LLQAPDGVDDGARGLVHLVVPAEVAGVVVGDRRVDVGLRRELALPHEVGEQLGVVDDLEVAVEVGVLVLDGVEAVRARRDDLLHAGGVERLHVGLRHHLEQVLHAEAAGGVAGARLAAAEDGVLHARCGEQPGDGLGDLLRAVLQRAGAADPEQVVDVLGELPVHHGHLEVEALGPLHALASRRGPTGRRSSRCCGA
jgi:hypothetical protein